MDKLTEVLSRNVEGYSLNALVPARISVTKAGECKLSIQLIEKVKKKEDWIYNYSIPLGEIETQAISSDSNENFAYIYIHASYGKLPRDRFRTILEIGKQRPSEDEDHSGVMVGPVQSDVAQQAVEILNDMSPACVP